MVCKQCGCTIPKGTKFQQTKYKSFAFCSEECFNTYDRNYTVPAQRQLTDYIQSICDIEPNWPYITKQSKAIEKEYGLSQKQQLIIIRYAVEFEGVEFNGGYGLGQFFPKYIQPCQDFVAELKRNVQLAEDVTEDTEYKIKPQQQQIRRKQEDLEF